MKTPTATVVAIWNELTPYRLHVMRRVRDELPHIRSVNVFTHSFLKNSSPWAMEVTPDLNVVFDEPNRIPRLDQFLHSRAWALAKSIEQVVAAERPVFVLMHGHKDATRLMLIRRFRRESIPLAHASDANVFSERSVHVLRDPVRAWSTASRMRILSMMDAYMPMGVAGRAYYNLYGRTGVPFFPFPYEPDYSLMVRRMPEIESELRARHSLGTERRRFLYSGRLVRGKGIEVMLQAFGSIAHDCPQWDLVIAGDGPLRNTLEESVPPALKERVRFLGFMQMEQLRSAYHLCHALVHPSERDQWALVVNEAMAANLAVIATDVTGAAADLVRSRINGVLVRPGSASEIAEAMRHVAQPGIAEEYARRSAEVLADWRRSADPVAGFAAATEHFIRKGKRLETIR